MRQNNWATFTFHQDRDFKTLMKMFKDTHTHNFNMKASNLKASKYGHLCYQSYSAVSWEASPSHAENDKINSRRGRD